MTVYKITFYITANKNIQKPDEIAVMSVPAGEDFSCQSIKKYLNVPEDMHLIIKDVVKL